MTAVRLYRGGITSGATATKVRLYRGGLSTAAVATGTTKLRYYRAGIASLGVPQGPIVSSGSPQTVESGSPFTLVATASDPDGVIASRRWTLAGVPVGASELLTVIAPVTTTDQVFTYTYTATDNDGISTSAVTPVTVRRASIVLKKTDGTFAGLVARRKVAP